MDLLHLVDRLEELVASAQKMPIGNRAILDRRRLLDVVDQMRIAVPQEVREAQDIVAHRDSIRREAEEEGRILLAQAEERASRLVESHEITQAARRRAEEIATEAEARLEERIAEANADIQQRIQESRQIAREQMSAADDYARELLLRLQRQLETKDRVVVGVNQFTTEGERPPEILRIDPEVGRKRAASLAALRARRDNDAVRACLDRIRAAASTDENMMPLLIDAVEAYATVGEICGVLREEWGEYHEVLTI